MCLGKFLCLSGLYSFTPKWKVTINPSRKVAVRVESVGGCSSSVPHVGGQAGTVPTVRKDRREGTKLGTLSLSSAVSLGHISDKK